MTIRVDLVCGKRHNKLYYLIVEDSIYVIALAVLSIYYKFSDIGLWCRLLRMIVLTPTILLAFPRLSILLSSLSKAINSVIVTIGLFIYFVVVFATFGHLIFNGNDPYHFGTYGLAMWSFFHFAVFDNWSELWYINYYGCDAVPTELIMDLNHTMNNYFTTDFGRFKYNTCENPRQFPVASTLIFVSYTFICGYIGVNMILAAVVIGVKNSLDEYKHFEDAESEEQAVDSAQSLSLNESATSTNAANSPINSAAVSRENSVNGAFRGKRSSLHKHDTNLNETAEQAAENGNWKRILESVWSGVSLTSNNSYDDLINRAGKWYSLERIKIEVERCISSPIYEGVYIILSFTAALSLVCIYVYLYHVYYTSLTIMTICRLY